MNKNKVKTIKVLLDSGSSETLIASNLVARFKKIKTESTQWDTGAGKLDTNKKVNLYFTLPEFYEKKIITWESHVFKNHTRYDMIMG
jgi:hypothetical protein